MALNQLLDTNWPTFYHTLIRIHGLHSDPLKFQNMIFSSKESARPKHGWEGNTKMDLSEIGLGWMDWIHPAQDRDQ
jgi:hypothetical protein